MIIIFPHKGPCYVISKRIGIFIYFLLFVTFIWVSKVCPVSTGASKVMDRNLTCKTECFQNPEISNKPNEGHWEKQGHWGRFLMRFSLLVEPDCIKLRLAIGGSGDIRCSRAAIGCHV